MSRQRRIIWIALAAIVIAFAVLVLLLAGRRLFDGTTEVTLAAGETQLPDARPLLATLPASAEDGFEHPYFLFLPKSSFDEAARLLVEPNNTGSASDDTSEHRASAFRLALRGHPRELADGLGVPLLVPAFPRPLDNGTIYTHALDRDSLLVKGSELERLDLQLLAMVRHARGLLSASGVETRPGLWMHGFSASGSFVNRFTALHPDEVTAVSSGGLNALPILPLSEVEGRSLPYPIGIADIADLTGYPFDVNSYREVSQLIYMGELDRNDTLPYYDAWNDDERDLIATVLGETMMPDRWRRVQALLECGPERIRCVTYDETGHEIRPEMIEDLVTFFRANDGSSSSSTKPHPLAADRTAED